jgi:hypothetical protein
MQETDPDHIGCGSKGIIFIDGVRVWTCRIESGDTNGYDYEVSAFVKKGSTVDFALDPDEGSWFGSFIFCAKIIAK